MVKLKYTTASAVKEKEGKFMCQAEVLCAGKTNATQTCLFEWFKANEVCLFLFFKLLFVI